MKTALVMMPLDRMNDAFYVALLKDMDDSSYVALLKDMDDAIGWLKGKAQHAFWCSTVSWL